MWAMALPDPPWPFESFPPSGGTVEFSPGSEVDVGNFPATQPVSAASLPLPTGAATSAKQPALGTAGVASTDVITVQGISSGVAQPVSVSSVAPASAASDVIVNVTTAGTRVQLTAGACQHGFWLTARRGNTGSVFIGGSTVSSTVYGFDLLQGERVWLPLSNTNLIYIDSANNGDGVSVERC